MKYETPVMEIIVLDADVVTTSIPVEGLENNNTVDPNNAFQQ